MPGGEEEAKNAAQSTQEGEVPITEALITKRNLTFSEDEDLSEKMFHTLEELETVRLDREGITSIRNLEGLRNIHSLYLQLNKIQRIENLSCITSLRFLSLAGNQIRQVENLLDLQYLQFLDLSENLIEMLKLDELPQSLLILNLCGNPCTNKNGYRKMVIGALPLLLDLDKQPILERWTSDDEDKSSDEEEEFPELNGPFCAERGFFKDLEQELQQHQERRQQVVLAEHLARMETQPVLTDLPLLPAVPMAGDCSPAVTAEPEKESAPKATSSTRTTSSTKKPAPTSQKSSVRAKKGALAATASKTSLAAAPSTTKITTKRSTK
ncbi:leucine-rich repeat-containing protein 46 [Cricetulus griseus]|uniref:Leucine-rich repeat-containing protein 46 n=1 Tax=Cricetulus griseus TaxID=10029 RepID=G3H5U6_CRIGR|nr:leucine-rich repeat-containing protein 46 [Cricetulus griseus]XP_027279987.1 leucine-rich repeat-containing protein 46 [Cricetulus griseus]EGW05264.1 Leucine-rich repeat-containing protein 46 [Cricetulus griseus]